MATKMKSIAGKIALFFLPLLLLGVGCVPKDLSIDTPAGVSMEGSQWMPSASFSGYKTKSDPAKIDDSATPMAQNTWMNDGDRISVRPLGSELFPDGTATSSLSRITSLHTFRKRNGENILMMTQGAYVEIFDRLANKWATLQTVTTTGREFGFADYNINTDLQSFVYFGNGEDLFSRWTGNYTGLSSAITAGGTTLTVTSTDGFPAAGRLIYCGVEINYTAKTATTFTVGSSHACEAGDTVAQAVQMYPENPRGNLYMVANNRLFISGITTTPQYVHFSQYGEARNFVSSSLVSAGTATDAGIFNLGEGGGAVTGMIQDENSLYFFKRSIIYRATLADSFYTLTALKPFDGKSQTTGAVSQKSIFAGGNAVYFITPDNQIMSLSRVENVDYPQVVPISDSIKPTADAAVFASSTGIVFEDHAYFAAKIDSVSGFNDVVFAYNIPIRAWEPPIVGWNVGDWAVYDSGSGEDLYFGHSNTADLFKITTTPIDSGVGVTANWRTKRFDFGLPYAQKDMENLYVEGYIADGTTLSISLLLDEDGYTQIFTTQVTTTPDLVFTSDAFNLFGFNVFGYERFGSNEDQSGKKKFRAYLGKDFRVSPFYTAQLEFASDGENQSWEITNYAFRIRPSGQIERRKLYKAFKE
jgi:hypothetical protein